MGITLIRAKHSIYRRLTGWLLIGVGLLLLATGIILDAMIGERLRDRYDQALLAKGRILVALTGQDQKGVEFDLTDELMPEFELQSEPLKSEPEIPPNPEYFQLWRADGSILGRSLSLANNDLPRLADWNETPRFADLTLPDGRAGRRVQIGFLPHLDTDEDDEDRVVFASTTELLPEPLTLVLAHGREPLDELLGAVRLMLLAAGACVMGLIVLLVHLAVGISLRPLADIRAQVARLDADSLEVRLKPQMRTEELDGIVHQFNAMLDRLQTAFERERQFSDDVAHELRTPLTELHNLAEVGSRWSDDPALARDFFDEVLAATHQLERIVVNLLALARCEKGLEVVESTEIDLVSLIDAAWQRVLPEAQAKQLGFERQGPSTLIVHTGRDPLELILNNLLSNAVAYSPAGGAVTCTVVERGGALSISIANHAEHLDNSDLPHLFERLWRKDSARTSGHHAGLGLNLVKAYAERLKLAIQVTLEPDQLFRITLSGDLSASAKK